MMRGNEAARRLLNEQYEDEKRRAKISKRIGWTLITVGAILAIGCAILSSIIAGFFVYPALVGLFLFIIGGLIVVQALKSEFSIGLNQVRDMNAQAIDAQHAEDMQRIAELELRLGAIEGAAQGREPQNAHLRQPGLEASQAQVRALEQAEAQRVLETQSARRVGVPREVMRLNVMRLNPVAQIPALSMIIAAEARKIVHEINMGNPSRLTVEQIQSTFGELLRQLPTGAPDRGLRNAGGALSQALCDLLRSAVPGQEIDQALLQGSTDAANRILAGMYIDQMLNLIDACRRGGLSIRDLCENLQQLGRLNSLLKTQKEEGSFPTDLYAHAGYLTQVADDLINSAECRAAFSAFRSGIEDPQQQARILNAVKDLFARAFPGLLAEFGLQQPADDLDRSGLQQPADDEDYEEEEEEEDDGLSADSQSPLPPPQQQPSAASGAGSAESIVDQLHRGGANLRHVAAGAAATHSKKEVPEGGVPLFRHEHSNALQHEVSAIIQHRETGQPVLSAGQTTRSAPLASQPGVGSAATEPSTAAVPQPPPTQPTSAATAASDGAGIQGQGGAGVDDSDDEEEQETIVPEQW